MFKIDLLIHYSSTIVYIHNEPMALLPQNDLARSLNILM